jgi:hypothetical protein
MIDNSLMGFKEVGGVYLLTTFFRLSQLNIINESTKQFKCGNKLAVC